MAKQLWFATLLTDSAGVWSGRFMRPGNLADAARDGKALAAIYGQASDAGRDDGALFLPAYGDSTGWRAEDFVARGRLQTITVDGSRIELDTAREPDWSFAEAGPNHADTGWLLNRPAPSGGAQKKRSPVQLIHLLAEIERDADTRELEKAFRADPELSFQLLRLLNSAAFGMRTPVRSLGHAITLLGRRQLQRWLQLLIYAQSGREATAPNPLLQLAAYRGHLLEDLARHAHATTDEVDAAYMTGIFSLLDRIIALPLAQIVRQLPLARDVSGALANGDGRLGAWLALVVACERGEFSVATRFLEAQEVTPDDWLRMQDAAYFWAYGLGKVGEVPA